MGTADPIPFGMEAPPYVCIRLQPISGGLCRYSVTSADADNDNAEEDIVQLERVPSRIIHTGKWSSAMSRIRHCLISIRSPSIWLVPT